MFVTAFQVLIGCYYFLLSLLFSKPNKPNCLFGLESLQSLLWCRVLQIPNYLGSPLQGNLQFFNLSLDQGAPDWTQYFRYGLTNIKHRGIIIPLSFLAIMLLVQPNILFTYSETVNLEPTVTLRSFSAGLLLGWFTFCTYPPISNLCSCPCCPSCICC